MLSKYLTFSVSITVISWVVGIVFNNLFSKTPYWEKLSSLNLIKSKKLQKAIKLNWFKWIVKNTFFKFFNPTLTLKGNAGIEELQELRDKMTFAELNHLVGFVFVSIFALVKLIQGLYLFALIMMIINILLNLYPSLLQQQNKSRIDRFIMRLSRRTM